MPEVSIQIPQLGEGLQEARLVRFLKQPGESAERDTPLYEMETDKAVTEVESPFTGVVKEWLVEEDTVHEIGATIGTMVVEEAQSSAPEAPAGSSESEDVASAESSSATDSQAAPAEMKTGVPIPPRTRRYLKEKNLESVAGEIPASGSRLTEQDVDRYIEQHAGTVTSSGDHEFDENELPKPQQTLNYRMARGMQAVIPVSLETDVDWSNIQAARESTRDSGGPTGFAMFLWCVSRAMMNHPALRSSLGGDGKTLRTFNHVSLGVAVGLPGDELKTAVVPKADTLDQKEFFASLSERIGKVREGEDQADGATTVSVSNIGATDMRMGIPVVVAPAVATIAVGQVRQLPVPDGDSFRFQLTAAVTMSFDHRIINGIGAANFLSEVRDAATNFTLDL